MFALIASLLLLPPQSFPTGQALLDSSYQKVLKATSISFVLTAAEIPPDQGPLQLSMMRGGYFRMSMPKMLMISTPKDSFMVMLDQKQYMKVPSQAAKVAQEAMPFPGFEGLRANGKPLTATSEPKLATVDGKRVYRVGLAAGDNPMLKATPNATLLIDAVTAIPAGLEVTQNGKKMTLSYGDLKLNSLSESDFTWTPPADWKDMAQGGEIISTSMQTQPSSGEDEYSAKLLKVGSKVPDFSAKTPDGVVTKLSTLMSGHKATLVNFWFYG